MAGENVRTTVSIKVEADGSLKIVTKDVQTLNKELDKTISTASKMSSSVKQIANAAQTGTKASRAALQGAGTSFKAQHENFDKARGISQSSGAAARDFANQSRGLGGLVRLYATFAANLFALGAAFRALSGAMDTSNMVKGLDQLGASVGRNLGGLSKELVEISGGAISLAQAMKAVAQTSTGGLSGENIKRLGGVARTAAAALGVAMPDAVNRLSRAITKLEPELLDELGIMTRLEPAVDIYARQLGKASSQLTQFERRQAFANAVLAEGEEKFGAIEDIPVNTFDVLASSLKDILQDGTAVINKFLVPAINLFASSPTALMAGMAALVFVIGKQFIPAFQGLKGQFAATAEAARETAQIRGAAAAQALVTLKATGATRIAVLQSLAEKEVQVQKDLVAKSEAINVRRRKANPSVPFLADTGVQKRIATIATKPVEELQREDIALVQRQADAMSKLGGVRAEQGAILDKLAKSLGRELDTSRDQTIAIKRQTAAVQDNTVFKKAQTAASKAARVSAEQEIISNLALNSSLIGRTAAMRIAEAATKKLDATAASAAASAAQLTVALAAGKASAVSFAGSVGIAAASTGHFAKASIFLRTQLASLSAEITKVGAAINKLFAAAAAATVLVIVFEALKGIFSGNTKEIKTFNSAIEDAESAIDNMDRTLKLMTDKGLKGSIAGIIATGNAFEGLATSIKAVTEASREAQENTTFIDTLEDGVRSIFGGGVEKNANEALTNLTLGAIKSLDQSGLKEVGEAKFREILGITGLDSPLNKATVSAALEALGEAGQNDIVDNFARVGQELSNVGSRMESFKTSTVAANLAFAQLIQSTASSDPIFRLGVTMQGLAASMIKVVASGSLVTEQIDAIILDITQNSDNAILFGPKTVANILEVKDEVIALNAAKKEILDIDKALAKASSNERFKDSDVFKERKKQGIEVVLSDQLITFVDQMTKERKAAAAVVATQAAVTEKSAKVFSDALTESFTRGSALIAQATGEAEQKAALNIRKAQLGGLSGEGLAKEQLAISKEELKIRLVAVDTSIDLITSQEAMRAAIEENTAASVLASAVSSGAPAEEITELKNALSAAEIFLSAFNGKEGFSLKGFQEIVDGLEDGIVKQLVQVRGITPKSQIGSQDATRTLLESQDEALDITGGRAVAKGAQEDAAKLVNLKIQGLEADKNALEVSRQIAGFASAENSAKKAALDTEILQLRHSVERQASQVAISNASGTEEKLKQKALALEQLRTQEIQRQNLATKSAVEQAENALVASKVTRDLTLAGHKLALDSALGQLDVQQAQNAAANIRFNISDSVRASMQAEVDLASLILTTEQARGVEAAKLEAIKLRASVEIAGLDALGAAGAADAAAARAKLDNDILASEITQQNIANTAVLEAEVLSIREDSSRELDRQNRLLETSSSLAEDLGKTFGKVGKSMGSVAKVFSKFAVNLEKNQGAINTLLKKRARLDKASIKDNKKIADNEKDLGRAREKSFTDQLDGISDVAGAGKSFFDDQSKGFKILEGIERAFTVFSIAMKVARTVADEASTIAAVGFSGTRTAATVVEAGVDSVAAVIKTIASIPFPGNLIAGAAVAAVVGGLLATMIGGGGGPDVASTASVGFTAEDRQEVQGSGVAFENGKRVDRAGGVLGSSVDKVEDISRSLELIEESTEITSIFGSTSLKILQQIEQNTKALAGALFSTTNIGKLGSGFDTVEGTRAKGGFFGSKKVTTEVIDKGLLVTGTFDEILSGLADFLEFETLKITKKKKSLFGSNTRTNIEEQTKELTEQAEELVIDLFSGLTDAAREAAQQVFGSGAAIDRILEDFQVDFRVSGLDLSGEDFQEAILSESNVVLNQVLTQALPVLEVFRELGEGFLGTLIRLATGTAVISEKFGRLGIDLEESFNNLPLLPTSTVDKLKDLGQDAVDALNTGIDNAILGNESSISDSDLEVLRDTQTQFSDKLMAAARTMGTATTAVAQTLVESEVAFTDSKLAILGTRNALLQFTAAEKILSGELEVSGDRRTDATNNITDEVLAFVDSSKTFTNSISTMVLMFTDRVGIITEANDNIIKGFGGIESFVEKTGFVFENFLSEEEQITIKTGELNVALADLAKKGFLTTEQLESLTDGTGNLGAEYFELMIAQDYLSESGIRAADAIFTLAPAVIEVTDEIVSLLDRLSDAGIGIDDFADLLESAIAGELEPEELGTGIAESIRSGFFSAISASFVAETSKSIVNTLISPILTGMLKGALVANDLFSTTIDTFVSETVAKASALTELLSNPEFVKAVDKVTGVITELFADLNGIGGDNNAAAIAEERATLQEQLNDLTDTAAQALERQRSALHESNRELFDQIQLVIRANEIANERNTLQEQFNSLTDTATEALTRQKDALDASNQTLFDQIQTILAVEPAFKALTDAVKKQKVTLREKLKIELDGYKAQLSTATTSVAALKAVFASLKATQQSLTKFGSTTGTLTIDPKDIAASLGVGAGTFFKGFSDLSNTAGSFTSFVASAADAVEEEVSAAEAQIEVLNALIKVTQDNFEQEISKLDTVISNAQAQVNALNKIDSSVLSVVDAIGELALAIEKSTEASIQATADAAAKATADKAKATAADKVFKESLKKASRGGSGDSNTELAEDTRAARGDTLGTSITGSIIGPFINQAAEDAAAKIAASLEATSITIDGIPVTSTPGSIIGPFINQAAEDAAAKLAASKGTPVTSITSNTGGPFNQAAADAAAASRAAFAAADKDLVLTGDLDRFKRLVDEENARSGLKSAEKALKDANDDFASARSVGASNSNGLTRAGTQSAVDAAILARDAALAALENIPGRSFRPGDRVGNDHPVFADPGTAATALAAPPATVPEVLVPEVVVPDTAAKDTAETIRLANIALSEMFTLNQEYWALIGDNVSLRELELAGISEGNKGLKESIFLFTDLVSGSKAQVKSLVSDRKNLDVELLTAQGDTKGASALSRAFALKDTTDARGTASDLLSNGDLSAANKAVVLLAVTTAKSTLTTLLATEAVSEADQATAELGVTTAETALALFETKEGIAELAVSTANVAIAAFDANEAIRVQIATLEERNTLQEQLNDLTDTATQALTRQRDALFDSNKALFDTIQAVILTRTATDEALAAVEKAIDAEKTRINGIIEAAEKTGAAIEGVFDLLKTNIEGLLGIVTSTKAQQASEGNAFIERALVVAQATGTLPDAGELGDAITAARGGLDNSQFNTRLEADKASLIMAGKLSQLKDIAEPQLTAAETSLQNERAQLEALDAQLEEAQRQVDVLNGINTSVLSVGDAIIALDVAMAAQSAAMIAAIQAAAQIAAIQAAAQIAAIQAAARIAATPTQIPPGATATFGPSGGAQGGVASASQATFTSLPGGMTKITLASGEAITLTNSISASNLAAAVNNPNRAALSGALAEFGRAQGLQGFADGGFTPGGDVIVGERGPEIVNLPRNSFVNNNQDSKKLVDNTLVVSELKQLRADMNAVLISIAQSTAKTASKIVKIDTIGVATRA